MPKKNLGKKTKERKKKVPRQESELNALLSCSVSERLHSSSLCTSLLSPKGKWKSQFVAWYYKAYSNVKRGNIGNSLADLKRAIAIDNKLL
jgi:hypothetical protein